MPKKPTRIQIAAEMRVQGASWDRIAVVLGYKSGKAAAGAITSGKYRARWLTALADAREKYLDEVEAEALLTLRELLRPTRPNGEARDERIREAAAHSLLGHCRHIRGLKVDLRVAKTPADIRQMSDEELLALAGKIQDYVAVQVHDGASGQDEGDGEGAAG